MVTPGTVLLEAVVNVSDGRDLDLLAALGAVAAPNLLDVHRDPDHHRSVLTLAGPADEVEAAVRRVATLAVERIDLREHQGVHPRLGALDVVPFVALRADAQGWLRADGLAAAVAARDRFADWAGRDLDLPCFAYGPAADGDAGPELPDLRRRAWRDLVPVTGPRHRHPSAGACCVGARRPLVAWNLWLDGVDLAAARALATALRRPGLRSLGLAVGTGVQVSCNLVAPETLGPAEVYDLVVAAAPPGAQVRRAELVGLVPIAVLAATDPARWEELDLGADRTIEARLEPGGPRWGKS